MKNVYWRMMEGVALAAKPVAAAFVVLSFLAVMMLAGVAIAMTVFGDFKMTWH